MQDRNRRWVHRAFGGGTAALWGAMAHSIGDESRIAAVLFDRDEEVDAAVADFVAAARRGGARVAGFVQERIAGSDRRDVRLRDVESGAQIAILQDLGPGASGCRVDPAALALAAGRLGRRLDEAPDLVILNRFGKLECDGGGLSAELGRSVALGLPVLVAVPLRFRDAWNDFAGGLDVQLAPRRAALEAWWARARLAPARG